MKTTTITIYRQRKTKDPCSGCGLHQERCLCDAIPTLNLKTQVCLMIHHRELKRTTNTGQLAMKALTNSQMFVRGRIGEKLNLSSLVDDGYRNLLFYPSEDAIELSQEFLKSDSRPVRLIVPDGNWRQASKVHSRHPELKDIPRVKISEPNTAQLHLRAEHKPEGMSTLQAIAKALGVIEGPEVGKKLSDLYELKLQRTWQGRGY